MALKAFISYSHKDDQFRQELEAHLKILQRQGSCDWRGAKFGALQGVPDNAKPIAQWSDRDEAFTIVAGKIREAAASIAAAKSVKTPGSHKTLVDVNWGHGSH
jgi:hypothetical protein